MNKVAEDLRIVAEANAAVDGVPKEEHLTWTAADEIARLTAELEEARGKLAVYRDAVGKELMRLGCPEEGANQFLRDVDRVVSARAALSAPEDKP